MAGPHVLRSKSVREVLAFLIARCRNLHGFMPAEARSRFHPSLSLHAAMSGFPTFTSSGVMLSVEFDVGNKSVMSTSVDRFECYDISVSNPELDHSNLFPALCHALPATV